MAEQISQSEEPVDDAVNVGSEEPWHRMLYMIGFGILSYALLWFVLAMAALQFVLVIVQGEPNPRLKAFAQSVNHYFRTVLAFLSFKSDRVPAPFSPMPDEND